MKKFMTAVLSVLILGFYAASIQAVEPGDSAPGLSLQTLDGDTFNLADHNGEVVLLYTFGCT
jgi:hypothetical protein